MDGVWRIDISRPSSRCPAEGALGIRSGIDRRLPPRPEPTLFADAVHLCSGKRLIGEGLPDAADAVLRISERSDLLVHRRRVHVWLRSVGSSAFRRNQPSPRLPTAGTVDRLSNGKKL